MFLINFFKRKTWPGVGKKCWFFHKWGKEELSSGVAGIDCDYIRCCHRCGAHQTRPSGIAKPYHFPADFSGEDQDQYMKATRHNVFIC